MSKEKKILLIILFNLIIVFSEITFGIVSNSFVLIADALHNAGDIIAIVITYIGIIFSTNEKFGKGKPEMMAAFVNSIFLYLTMIYLIFEALQNLFNPQIIEPIYMIWVGGVAFIANGISAYILNTMSIHSCSGHNHSHEGDNIKSAYLHMLADAMISIGVVLAGIFIYFFKVYNIDSILTIIFSIYIMKHSFPIFKRSFLNLLK